MTKFKILALSIIFFMIISGLAFMKFRTGGAMPDSSGTMREISLPSENQPTSNAAHDYVQAAELNSLIQKYLEQNPEVILESIKQHHKTQAKEAADAQKVKFLKLQNDIYRSANDPKLGNPDGKIKIVEFFDYACGHCKNTSAVNKLILEEFPDAEIILKSTPILGAWSVEASKAAIAVNLLDKSKNQSLHEALLLLEERTPAAISKIVAELGIDAQKFADLVHSPKVEETVKQNLSIAEELSIDGVPTYIINNQVISRMLKYSEIKAMLTANSEQQAQGTE